MLHKVVVEPAVAQKRRGRLQEIYWCEEARSVPMMLVAVARQGRGFLGVYCFTCSRDGVPLASLASCRRGEYKAGAAVVQRRQILNGLFLARSTCRRSMLKTVVDAYCCVEDLCAALERL